MCLLWQCCCLYNTYNKKIMTVPVCNRSFNQHLLNYDYVQGNFQDAFLYGIIYISYKHSKFDIIHFSDWDKLISITPPSLKCSAIFLLKSNFHTYFSVLFICNWMQFEIHIWCWETHRFLRLFIWWGNLPTLSNPYQNDNVVLCYDHVFHPYSLLYLPG